MEEKETKPLDTDHMIKPGDFVEVSGDGLEPDGISDGTLMWVANMQAFPIDPNDLYMQRLHVIMQTVNPDFTIDTSGAMVTDPKNLRKVTDEQQKLYYQKLEAMYAPDPTEEEVVH